MWEIKDRRGKEPQGQVGRHAEEEWSGSEQTGGKRRFFGDAPLDLEKLIISLVATAQWDQAMCFGEKWPADKWRSQ